ncbi:hypothetical protein RBG61_06770 [Paludicola sp. MB14-C6]|uniref:hypothetical protein n=1 Tax=Paludihabitans sp. MB14-C6 TaxID=3070656 RepID=UPI0027DDDE8B|nr:hypothetical protein [Paludicola sp. MB14-C6]WMJ24364.1 hypothetical protein RBG61_06770 [Paludicola sp. MB14-C6]
MSKKSIILSGIIILLVFSLCSCSTNSNYKVESGPNNLISSVSETMDNSSKMDSSQRNTSNESSYSKMEEQFTKIKKEEYDGEVHYNGVNQLTNRQLLFINKVLDSFSEAHIICNFKSIDDIAMSDFPTYLGFRSKYYFDVLLDKEQKAQLNYNQILTILKGDFGIEKAPQWLEEKKNEINKAPFSSQGNPSDIQSINQKQNIVTVVAKMYPTHVRDSSEKEFLPNTVKYIFEVKKDDSLYLKSGEII